MVDFFDRPACVNERFANYFGGGDHEHICDQPATRCSWHWNTLAGSADDVDGRSQDDFGLRARVAPLGELPP